MPSALKQAAELETELAQGRGNRDRTASSTNRNRLEAECAVVFSALALPERLFPGF
jgi:hypothetical protein